MIKSILQHLRFPFSVLLMPVFLFALAELPKQAFNEKHCWLLFVILHLLIYPSSNAFNSLQDDDKGSIGLLEKPLPAVIELRYVTIAFDVAGILLSLLINIETAIGVFIYIVASRLYSYRPVRLKKYPVTGFLIVFIFQGYWIFALVQYVALGVSFQHSLLMAICSSCLIGAIYPLSQIYQHKQDKEDGVISISYILGYNGTFMFSAILYLIGNFMFAFHHLHSDQFIFIVIFNLCQMPVFLFFLYWFYQVWKDRTQANFKNTMRLNIISAICMNACFIILYFYK